MNNETLCEACLESVPAPIGGFLSFIWPRQIAPALPYHRHPCLEKKETKEKATLLPL
jgi:hypothetical protein